MDVRKEGLCKNKNFLLESLMSCFTETERNASRNLMYVMMDWWQLGITEYKDVILNQAHDAHPDPYPPLILFQSGEKCLSVCQDLAMHMHGQEKTVGTRRLHKRKKLLLHGQYKYLFLCLFINVLESQNAFCLFQSKRCVTKSQSRGIQKLCLFYSS